MIESGRRPSHTKMMIRRCSGAWAAAIPLDKVRAAATPTPPHKTARHRTLISPSL
jgi:hypothetical protein